MFHAKKFALGIAVTAAILATSVHAAPKAEKPISSQATTASAPQEPIKVPAGKVLLPSGSKLSLELAEPLASNKAKVGDEVVYYVKEDILTADRSKVLIRKGAHAVGHVTKAKGAKSFGRKGKLEFTVEEVEAVDGTLIPLRSTLETSGKGRTTAVALTAAFLTVFGVFIKGKNVQVPQGTVFEAYIDQDTAVTPAVPLPQPVAQKARK